MIIVESLIHDYCGIIDTMIIVESLIHDYCGIINT
jgi:hypothetical protein